MKKTLLFIGLTVLTAVSFSCKKDKSNNPTDTKYFIQYTDNGKDIKLETELTSGLIASDYLNQRIQLNLFDGNKNYLGDFYIVLPIDSSDISKIKLNTLYKTVKYKPEWTSNGFSLEDSTIGAIYHENQQSNGTIATVDNYSTVKYYNKIKTIKYLKHDYSKWDKIALSYYIITGEFCMQVKNDYTNTTSDFSNGSYNIMVGFMPK